MASGDWGTPKAKKQEEDEGILGKAIGVLGHVNPAALAYKAATRDISATPLDIPDKLAGSDNVIAKNLGGAASLFNPAKVVPALAGGAIKTGLEAARAIPTAALAASAGSYENVADFAKDDSALSFLYNTEVLKNMGKDQPLANKLLANIQTTSPLLGNVGAAGGETVGRVTRETQSGVSRIPGGPEFRTAEELARGTGLEGRTYGELMREGEGGAALLGDVLSAAPVARGLAGTASRAGILSEANAARVAGATRAIEAAPLKPISAPLKAGYEALNRASGLTGEAAFPRIAAAAEGGGKLAGVAGRVEQGAQAIGDVWRDTGIRERTLAKMAENKLEAGPELAKIEERMGELDPATPEYAAAVAERNNLLADIEDFAKAETKYELQRESAQKQGMRLSEFKESGKIPRGLDDASIEKALKGLGPKEANNWFTKTFDDITGAWKAGVLPLNPAWQAGNVVSNGVTAMTYGEVSPLTAAKNHKWVMEQMDNPTEVGAGIVKGGGQAGQFDRVTSTKPGAKTVQRAYNLNEMVDDYGHLQVYKNRLDKLRAQGIADDIAQRQAADFAMKTMGNFTNMSAFERNVLRRAVPFYAWSKHSAKMSLREAALNPGKIARIQNLANVTSTRGPEGKGTEFLEGQMALGGGRFLRLPGGMEQGAPAGLLENPLTNPTKLLGGIHPLAQLPMVAAGFNPRAGRKLSTSPGQSGISGATGYAVNQIPIIRTAADLLERSPVGFRGENVIKGDTRGAILAGGRPIRETKEDITPLIPAPLLRFLTGAQVDVPDVKGSKARAEEQEKKDEKSAKKYNRGAAKKAKK